MKAFARLYVELDATTSTSGKLDALARYYASASPDDAAWATYYLAGGKPRQAVPTAVLRDAALEASALPAWLFEESYQAVGDFAETLAHVLAPAARVSDVGLAEWVARLAALRGADPAVAKARLIGYWNELDWNGRFLLIKLIGGGFRVGVSRLLVTRALAAHASVDAKTVAQRVIGYTHLAAQPDAEAFRALIAPEGDARGAAGHPYPFFLAHQLNADPATLGDPADWMVEWKWDGIRAQLVVREGGVWLWSRGEELVTERFPELGELGARLPPGTVIDGEIVVWRDGAPRPFAELQTRIGRKSLGARILASTPVALVAYDLLERDGLDLRERPQAERRAALEALVTTSVDARLVLSPLIERGSWQAYASLRDESRERGVEGFMLKRRDARYGVGRTKSDGAWWKWKIDPMTVDAVLVYAQRGHGRRASLYTDYTFAVWEDGPEGRRLVPFAKAYSGLTDEEIARVDAIVRRTTVEKFGPVRSVTPTQVFELGFEGIARSTRHKSGIAVRFPRMLRWRVDKPVDEADTLATLTSLLGDASGDRRTKSDG
ncbi:MAG TPA: ATP-dependent DNA ligase [Casimicrobiaceae bacterium]|nr:ATP-dependent DNA ligase [Casimicrobiaceae bacterium]